MKYWSLILYTSCLFVCIGALRAVADYRDDIGYTRLTNEFGATISTADGITVSHVESPGPYYMPDVSTSEFAGKTFVDVSDVTNASSPHATQVGSYLYGSDTSIAPGIKHIDVYSSVDWLSGGSLHASQPLLYPEIETNHLQNHSWIWTGSSETATNPLRRLDYAVERDGFTAVVGLNNTTSGPIPELLAHGYNSISVGRSDGKHSTGETTFDVAGRCKPDIVVPLTTTSRSVPVVNAVAAILMESARTNAGLTNALMPQCVKALIMAGASKEEFPAWSRTSSKPLDDIYGAGELNVYNSYQILFGGEQTSSATSVVQSLGWDFNYILSGTGNYYYVEVPQGYVMSRLSVVLVWHRGIVDGPLANFDPEPVMPELDLFLYDSTNYITSTLIDESTSQIDNVEHVYVKNLPEGQYAIEVTAQTATNYALAWYSRVAEVPEFSSIVMTNNEARFEVSVTPGIDYGIEVATNLLETNAWTRVTTNVSATNVMVYIDTDSATLSNRYYRVIVDP